MILFGDRRELDRIIARLEEITGGGLRKDSASVPAEPFGRLVTRINELVRTVRGRIEFLEKENSQMHTMLNSMVEGVIAVDKESRIISINPTVEALFSVPEDEVLGKFFIEAFRNNDIAELIKEVVGRREHIVKEISLSWPLQKIFQVSASAIIAQNTASGCLLVIHDITEVRRLEKMRSDFVANASHELKTPLTSIKGFVETLLEGAIEDRKNSVEFLKIIQNHTVRLENLINDLLSLSHIESKAITLTKEQLRLQEIIEAVLAGFKTRFKKLGLQVEVAITGDVLVEADKERLEQVFMNLIDNAIKFNREKGRIKVYSEPVEKGVKVVVEDTGVGIPQKDLNRIFERFYRVDKARSRELGGTGLGLSIVKHIIELHGGEVGVESTEGLGTRFWFTLPHIT